MSQAGTEVLEPVRVLIAVAVGRNGWIGQEATLYYEGSRLVRADGTNLTQTGSSGLSGILYVVVDSLCRENRKVLRVQRRKFVNGEMVNAQNWGEVEDGRAQAA